MEKKLLFIYNPHAGKGQVKEHLADILDTFTRGGWLVTARPTLGPGDAVRAARELAPEFDRVVCSGGDGTLHEVVSGLMPLERRPVVGYIPAGSTNDFARNLRLPRGFSAMAAAAAAGTPLPVDIGLFNDRFFVYVAAFGAFTDVAYDTPQQFKNVFGHLAYVLEGASRLGSIASYRLRITHDGGVLEDEYIFGMVSNTVSVGGMKSLAGNNVRLDDGLFETVLVKTPSTPAQLGGIIHSLLQPADPCENVVTLRTGTLEVESELPLPWTLDGEYGGDPAKARIENCRHAVTIVHGA